MTKHPLSLNIRWWLTHFTDEHVFINHTVHSWLVCTSNLDLSNDGLGYVSNIDKVQTCTPVTVPLSLSHVHPFPSLPTVFMHTYTHTQGDTRGRVDAALSALRWGVLLLTTVWIEAAVHPLLSGCCRAAGLTFVLRSIMARHNYSLSREGTQAVSTLPLASPQLAGQQRHTQANISFKCVLKLNYVSPWCVTVTGTGSHALVNLAYSKPYSLASLPPGSSSGLIVIDKVNKQTKITYICRQASVFPTHIAPWLAIDDDIRCVTQIIGKNIKFCRLARLCLTPIFHRAGVSNSN